MEAKLRAKDEEDLALFKDIQTRELHNYLYLSNHDIDIASCSPTPLQRGTCHLLTGDIEKSEYNWLLTPPGTPLFPLLDREFSVASSSSTCSFIYSTSDSRNFKELSPKLQDTGPDRNNTAFSTSSSSRITRRRVSPSSVWRSSPNSQISAQSSTPMPSLTSTVPTIESSTFNGVSRNKPSSMSPQVRYHHPLPLHGFSSERFSDLQTSESSLSSMVRSSKSPILTRQSNCNVVEKRKLNCKPMSSTISSTDSCHSRSQNSKGYILSLYDNGTEICKPMVMETRNEAANCIRSKYDTNLHGKRGCTNNLLGKQQKRVTKSRISSCRISTKKDIQLFQQHVDNQRSSQPIFRPMLSGAPRALKCSTKHNTTQKAVHTNVLESSITNAYHASVSGSSLQDQKVAGCDGQIKSDGEESQSLRNRESRKFTDEDGMRKKDDIVNDHALHPCKNGCLGSVQNQIESSLPSGSVQLEQSDGNILSGYKTEVDESSSRKVLQNITVSAVSVGSPDESSVGTNICRESLLLQHREESAENFLAMEVKCHKVLARDKILDTGTLTNEAEIVYDPALHPFGSSAILILGDESEFNRSTKVLHDFASEILKETISQVKEEHLINDASPYISTQDALVHRDIDSLNCRYEDIESLFVDIQNWPLQSDSNKLHESVSEKCYPSVELSDTEDPHFCRTSLLRSITNQENIEQEVSVLPESEMGCSHEPQNMMLFEVEKNVPSMERGSFRVDTKNSSYERSPHKFIFLFSDFTLETDTDTIVFCYSIVQDIMTTILEECSTGKTVINKEITSAPEIQRQNEMMLVGMHETRYLYQPTWSKSALTAARRHSTVQRTLAYVQRKQRLMFQQAPLVTHQHYFDDQTSTAIIEDVEACTQINTNVPHKNDVKVTKVKCRCKCTIM